MYKVKCATMSNVKCTAVLKGKKVRSDAQGKCANILKAKCAQELKKAECAKMHKEKCAKMKDASAKRLP
jgi:hypothetical protein